MEGWRCRLLGLFSGLPHPLLTLPYAVALLISRPVSLVERFGVDAGFESCRVVSRWNKANPFVQVDGLPVLLPPPTRSSVEDSANARWWWPHEHRRGSWRAAESLWHR